MQYLEFDSPPTLNKIIKASRANKFQAASEKKKWTKYIAGLAIDLEPVTQAWVAVEWTYKMTNSDPDNALAGILKVTLDGLVRADIIPGDTVKEVLSPMFYSYCKGDSNRAKVILFDNFAEYQKYILSKIM